MGAPTPMPTPRPARPRRIQKGTRESDIHSGHRFARPSLRSARRLRPRDGAERSKGPCGCLAVRLFGCSAVGCLTAQPPAGCACGGAVVGWHGRRSAHASCSSSLWLSGRRCAAAKRVPRRTPQPPRRRFAPSQREGVADWGSPFFWVLFFGEAKNKYLARRGESRLPPGTLACSSHRKPRLQQAKTKRSRQDSIATKTIAASAL